MMGIFQLKFYCLSRACLCVCVNDGSRVKFVPASFIDIIKSEDVIMYIIRRNAAHNLHARKSEKQGCQVT
jgi:hypothetical protein